MKVRDRDVILARTPASGWVTADHQADAVPSSAGRRQLGRRAASVAARALAVHPGPGIATDADLLMRLTAQLLAERPLRTPDNAAVVKIATNASRYLASDPVAAARWLGLLWHQLGTLERAEPMLVFQIGDLVYADALLVGAQRHPRRDALIAAAGVRALATPALGDRVLAGVRVITPARPSLTCWVPGADPTVVTELPVEFAHAFEVSEEVVSVVA